jgi:hypothetical protein
VVSKASSGEQDANESMAAVRERLVELDDRITE